jgi:hypothetical protein
VSFLLSALRVKYFNQVLVITLGFLVKASMMMEIYYNVDTRLLKENQQNWATILPRANWRCKDPVTML